ncbi:unnamed protein product [Adineta steineri]|uniref:Uncharacterized protein n=1 Tax=Adineta steineri TaxID=433720 RepID=A0A818P9U7_9BILA|nr:unnamed protein product [Adineta steineri]CAF0981102.1 unnamed protein product [Adineta steineri]CAF3620171.1 unnamed protein product [Adineta steineri]CAF3620883.1 unnamed protein product [Adineta steineri]CAF3774786.1 unnamed protein product [Adineta steineri]
MNLLSCLGRQNADEGDPPDTPNIDKLKTFITRFQSDPNAETSFIKRPDSTQLCEWTKKVCEYLPSSTDANTATGDDIRPMKQHFGMIQQFYTSVQQAGFTQIPATVQTFLQSIQIYEAVSGLACVIFAEHPEILKVIENQLNEAREALTEHGGMGIIGLLCCGANMLATRFNAILRVIDEKLGELGIGRVLDFLGQIIDVFCKFFRIDMANIMDLQSIAETVRSLIDQVGQQLSSLFGKLALTGDKRTTNDRFAPLEMTSKIHRKISKFGTKAPVVEKALTSFQHFYQAANKVDDNLIQKHGSEVALQADAAAAVDPTGEPLLASNNPDNIDLSRSDAVQVSATNTVKEIGAIGHMMQNIELVLTYGILALKNEDEVLQPLSNHIDECTQILEKFSALHPLYKVICGSNYLSKLRVYISKIVDLLKNSNLKLNSPEEFIKEIKDRYPELLRLLADDIIQDKIKKHLGDKLPEGVENVLNDAAKNIFGKFSSKF